MVWMQWLLASFHNQPALSGEARLLDGNSATDWSFAGLEELCAPLTGGADCGLLVDGLTHSASSLHVLQAFSRERQMAVLLATHARYLTNSSAGNDLDGLQSLLTGLLSWLADIPDDCLAQLVALVNEAGAHSVLGLFERELFTRHDPLHQPAAGTMQLEDYYPRQTYVGTLAGKSVAPDILERVFSARTALAEAFAEYEERPQQIRMAHEVEQALSDSHTLVIEAGTGVGKSLAYLLPLAVHAARYGKLCLVSTNTINLQQQLLEQDIPRAKRILDSLEFKVTLLKGREHYLCLKRLQDTWLNSNTQARARRQKLLAGGPPALLFISRLLADFRINPQLDMDAIPLPDQLSQSDRAQLLGAIDCRYATCLGDRCEYRSHCHFFARRAEAESSHIVITNHALVFALHGTGDTEAEHLVSKAAVVVFDEAHNLESAITNQMTSTVSHEQPVEFANRLQEVMQHDACARRLQLGAASVPESCREQFARAQQLAAQLAEWVRLGVEVRDQISRLLTQAAEKGHLAAADTSQLTPSTATPGQAQVMQLLARLAQRLLSVLAQYKELAWTLHGLFANEDGELYIDDAQFQMNLQALAFELEESCLALENWKPEDPAAITWFNCSEACIEPRWEYRTAPLDAGPYFQSLLAGKDSVVLSSATLAVGESFEFLQRSLGFTPELIEATSWVQLDSPFDYASQSMLLVATDLAEPTGASREDYLVQLEEVAAGVCGIFPKGVLMLFNSYRDLNYIADRLMQRIPVERLLVQGFTGTREEIAESFRVTGDKVLLATRSFWEGFDVAGEALSCVVLAKLPFANFKDPILAGRQRAVEAAGESSFYKLSLPQAAMQLKQGFGRLIRSKRDYGCVFLLDSRVALKSYGKVFLSSLPGPHTYCGPYMHCLDLAQQFMQQQAELRGDTSQVPARTHKRKSESHG